MRRLCYIEKNNRLCLKETTIRKYYKTVTIEKNWVRPNLSSNGTMGGNAFAHDGSGYGGGLGELYITATYETTTTEECTNDDDWTSCKDFVTYKAFLKG